MILVLWGVTGCGKSTIGALLAEQTSAGFFDADDFHSEASKAKMKAGIALQDADRWPWLERLADLLRQQLTNGRSAVLACSALKQSYRDVLCVDQEQVHFVCLQGSRQLIAQRLSERHHAFMSSALLDSQIAILEPADQGVVIDVAHDPDTICQQILQQFPLQ